MKEKVSMFEEAVKRTTKRSRVKSPGRHLVGELGNLSRPNTAADYFRRARERAEHEAQHGPVKILWKDGRPV